jgi:hypothetical protein
MASLPTTFFNVETKYIILDYVTIRRTKKYYKQIYTEIWYLIKIGEFLKNCKLPILYQDEIDETE